MKNQTQHPIRVGVFRQLAAADHAVEGLIAAGFPAERISVICPECSKDAFPKDVQREDPAGANTRDTALAGGAIGAVLGGLTVGVGLAATGGTGLLIAGPLLAATGAGAVAGGFVGAMTTRGFEPEIADYYDQALTDGRILVAVDTDPGEDKIPSPERAEQVLKQSGSEPIAMTEG